MPLVTEAYERAKESAMLAGIRANVRRKRLLAATRAGCTVQQPTRAEVAAARPDLDLTSAENVLP